MAMPKPVLVSACLLGETCRYDGRDNLDSDLLVQLKERAEEAVPFCPEEAGGLPTPRPPAWIEGKSAEAVLEGEDRIVTGEGADVTAAFRRGAELALELCRERGIEKAYLKERSPSCGVRCTHVDAVPVEGMGLTSALLGSKGVEVEGRK